MTNLNETTSIETLSDDDLSLVGGGCSGNWQGYASYYPYASAGQGQGSGGDAVAAAQASADSVNINNNNNQNILDFFQAISLAFNIDVDVNVED